MAEFYVTFDWQEKHYLAIVVARERPERLQFATPDDLNAAMNALDHEWTLLSQVQISYEFPEECLETMAEAGALKQMRKPDWPLVTGRTFPGLA
jgi:hypothetical protein